MSDLYSHPQTTESLLYFGLITEEQAAEANERYAEMWENVFGDSDWWDALADIAWWNEVSWWGRMKYAFVPSFSWKRAWIAERRGW